MPSITPGEFRVGTKIEFEGAVYTITGSMLVTPGNLRSFVRTKMKNIETGQVIERNFRTSETVKTADIDTKKMEYLYHDGDLYNFMDTDSYEQTTMTEEELGDAVKYMKEHMQIEVQYYNGRAIGVEIPMKIELKVVETMPGVKGNTVSAATKPATLETGLIIQVPMFVNEGDTVKVDTRDGSYLERV